LLTLQLLYEIADGQIYLAEDFTQKGPRNVAAFVVGGSSRPPVSVAVKNVAPLPPYFVETEAP